MAQKIDLHVHTTASDGNLTPREIVNLALKKKLKAIAITDHDTISGIKEAGEYAKGKNIEIVPGVEITCDWKEEGFLDVHVLGLFIDYKNKELGKFLERFPYSQKRMFGNFRKMMNKFGFKFLDKKLFVKIFKAIYPIFTRIFNLLRKIFGREKLKIYKEKATLKGAVEIIKKAGGISFLAHSRVFNERDLPLLVNYFVKAGGRGIEVEYPYSVNYKIRKNEEIEMKKFVKKIAKKYKLLASGGSDFHGQLMRLIGIGEVGISLEEFLKLKNYVDK